jgi:hypothetical protein
MRSKYNNGACCYRVTTSPLLVVTTSPFLRHFVTMNYQNKEMIYKVKTMKRNAWILVVQMPRNPFDKRKITRGYKTGT